MHAQIDRPVAVSAEGLHYAHTGFFTSAVVGGRLPNQLARTAPAGLDQVYVVSGGSEAVEAALKLARQYFVEIGQPQRTHFIARRQSYHGNTLGALAVGGNEWRRRQFAPLLIDVGRVSPCYEYRDRASGEARDAYSARLLAELRGRARARIGPETRDRLRRRAGGRRDARRGAANVPGLLRARARTLRPPRHPVHRRRGDVRHGPHRHALRLRAGRRGARSHDDRQGLGGGYQPIGAVLAAARVVEPLRRGSGMFQHGHTYLGHPTAAAAALAVQRVIERDGLLRQVRERGSYLRRALVDRLGAHPHVGDIRGRGLFLGVELVADRASRAPFDPELKLHAQVKAEGDGECGFWSIRWAARSTASVAITS